MFLLEGDHSLGNLPRHVCIRFFGCVHCNPSQRLPLSRAPKVIKKTDVADHLEVINHVGLLVNEPPRHSRVALYLVIRHLMLVIGPETGQFKQ